MNHLGVEVNRIADIGCGLGTVLKQLGKAFPSAQLTGVEFSEHLVKTHGWKSGSVVNYVDDPFDLVVCNDVLGYLSARECNLALQNLAKLTRTALYLSVLTEEDMDICDQEHTDMRQMTRPHKWYRQRLEKHFVNVGGGLFLRKPLDIPLWRLERL